MLALPGPDDAEVLVVRADDGRWVAEQADGGVIEVGAQIRVRDQDWELELPEADPRTPMVQISEIPPLSLRFRVSPDEEYVDLVVRVGTIEHDLGARAHHYLLLTLARLRLRDQAARPAAVGEHGWVGLPRLTKMLRLEERPLNLQIFRIRRQFAELGVSQLTEIIERRRGTGQIRVGTAEVEILGTGG